MLTALKERNLTPVEKALESFEARNGFSFVELIDPVKKARFMRYGGDIRDNEDNELLKEASRHQQKYFDKE